MGDAQVPAAKWMTKFHLCLEGDIHDWYNDVTVPVDWDTLMTMFCQCFCVFSQTEEDWHEAWNQLSFNKATDNIDKFISKVKRLACQLWFWDHSILIKLKQLFPEKEDTWLVVHDLEKICGYLKRLYSPYNLKQNDPVQSTAPSQQGTTNTPFMASPMHQDQYHLKIHQDKNVHFNEPTLLSDKLDMLQDSLNHLADSQNHCDHNRSRRPFKPYIPYILKDHQCGFSRTCSQECSRPPPHFCPERHSLSGPPFHCRSGSRHPFQRFDRSPTVKKPKSSSKPVNKDDDRCFNCHQHGHFARKCPKASKELVDDIVKELNAMNSWPDLDGPAANASDPSLSLK